MTYTITEMFAGEWWVSSHKPHLGWSTIDKVCHSLEEAQAFTGPEHKRRAWYDNADPEPDFGQDYSSYREKELAYDYWEA